MFLEFKTTMNWITIAQTILELAANLAVVVGVPISIVTYIRHKRKEERDREYGTYNALDKNYFEYLTLCIERPKLNLYWLSYDDKNELSEADKIRQYALFEILVSLMERAYLMYSDQGTVIKQAQWEGWESYIKDWTKRPIFIHLWGVLGEQFDTRFEKYVNDLIPKDTINK